RRRHTRFSRDWSSDVCSSDLFNYERDHPHRYDLELDDLTWADIVSALVRHGIGTALAYIDHDNEVICHPNTNAEVEGKGLIVLEIGRASCRERVEISVGAVA